MIQALARGVCPICTLVRAFQNAMIEAPLRYPALNLCNFHTWSLAGSSPAVEVTRIFKCMLEGSVAEPSAGAPEIHPCDRCSVLREYEEERLSEFKREMERDNFRSWVAQYGTVCVFHGRKLMKVLAPPHLELVRKVLANNLEDLEKQLELFDAKVRRGEKGGAGVLGFIAEFLVSQRGITR